MTLLAFTFWQWTIGFAMVGVCCLLILVILGQPASGGGLVGAFGGGGGAAFGARTGDAFTWITVGLATMYLSLAVFGNYVFQPQGAPTQRLLDAGPADTGAPPADSAATSPTDASVTDESTEPATSTPTTEAGSDAAPAGGSESDAEGTSQGGP